MSLSTDILAELRAIRAVVERLAPKDVLDAVYAAESVAEGTKRVAGYRISVAPPAVTADAAGHAVSATGYRAVDDSVKWSCGHHHMTRNEAIACLHEQRQMARGES